MEITWDTLGYYILLFRKITLLLFIPTRNMRERAAGNRINSK